MSPDDHGAAPSDLAATNGYMLLAAQLRDVAGGLLMTSTRPTLIAHTESGRLYEHSC
jgi:hypothetical protein